MLVFIKAKSRPIQVVSGRDDKKAQKKSGRRRMKKDWPI
jgi:hypothetical protein